MLLKIQALTQPAVFYSSINETLISGQLEIVQHITSCLGDINPSDDLKNTPLHWAAGNGKLNVVMWYLEKLAEDKNPANEKDQTPLDWAKDRGHLEVVKAISEYL